MRRPALPEVTLVAVSSVALSATLSALVHSRHQVDCGEVLLLSDRPPPGLAGSGIAWRQIDPIESRADYSRFMLNQLCDHIETRHALVVQWDGFVRDGSAWRDEFQTYDYIGAHWPQYRDDMTVGNGGFSLRSRRLLAATATIDTNGEPEDFAICRTYRRYLEQHHGLRFADVDVANKFSYERGESTGTEFGFHGVFNMPAELPANMFRSLMSGLEPGVIGPRETSEMLARAVRAGDWRMVGTVLRHHRAHSGQSRRLLRVLGWLLRGHDGWPMPRERKG